MELIEANGGNQQRIVVFTEGFFDFSITCCDGELHCDVAARPRKLREGLDLEHILFDSKDLFLIEFGEVDGSFEADLPSPGGHDLSKGTNWFAAELNIATEEKAFASTGRKLNRTISKRGLDGGLEVIKVKLSVLITSPRKRASFSTEEKCDRIGFEIGGFATTDVSKLASGFEKAEGFGALSEIVFGRGKKSRSE